MIRKVARISTITGILVWGIQSHAGDDLIGVDGNTGQYTGFTNVGSILNSRHNLTQSTIAGDFGGAGMMGAYRNDYGEVCVYCHTPHGATTVAVAPLWNRSLPTTTTYQTYDKLNTSSLTQTVNQPGGASLPCLSCHDGQQAVDAIINMPGSGRYNPTPSSAAGAGGDLFTRWNVVGKRSLNHGALTSGTSGQECLSCHSPSGTNASAVDFTIFAISTDLRNDHPVGVNFPATTGAGTDWKTPNGSISRGGSVTAFFDENTNGRMDKGDIRLYPSGTDARVECASCHDPHGVTSGGTGTTFNPTFLRKTNTGSLVCLTCHSK